MNATSSLEISFSRRIYLRGILFRAYLIVTLVIFAEKSYLTISVLNADRKLAVNKPSLDDDEDGKAIKPTEIIGKSRRAVKNNAWRMQTDKNHN